SDVLKNMPLEEQLVRVRAGAKQPTVAVGIVQHLSGKLSGELVSALCQLDAQLCDDKTPAARELAKATIIALGHGDESAIEHLHQVFDAAPDRRAEVAQAVATFSAQSRRDADWSLLVRSLTVVEGPAARDVLHALVRFPQTNDKPQDVRQV